MPNPYRTGRRSVNTHQQKRTKITLLRALILVTGIILIAYSFHIFTKDSPHYDQEVANDIKAIVKDSVNSITDTSTSTSTSASASNWCDKVSQERSKLNPALHITYPCEQIKNPNQYKSAIVTILTSMIDKSKKSKIVFSGQDYINGAIALGSSLNDYMTRDDTLRLLLLNEGSDLPQEERTKLENVGWLIGTVPNVELENQYVPKFARYKTTYTKIAAIGLSEFDCVMLMDADALAVGSMDDLMSCNVFHDHTGDTDGNADTNEINKEEEKEKAITIAKNRPKYQIGGTLDLYHKKWYHFNTGSILWNTSAEEMNRVYALTKDKSFMKRFESDQIFLNHVYPDRMDKPKNQILIEEGYDGSASASRGHEEFWGQVVNLGWKYNAQTHVELQDPVFWKKHKGDLRIVHFTERKGWQCPEKYDEPTEEDMSDLKNCSDRNKRDELCFCGVGYLWWNALQKGLKN
jgi:hypothetical protein